MTKLVIAVLIVAALVGGLLLALRRSTRQGMPDAEVLERAKQRSAELESQERHGD